ncbi:MAG: alpha/beta fold hydrolase [Sandaracinaceae bacterium]|nr:alpha/beta fold hydrolase [Sandaracinaceae bacterium]
MRPERPLDPELHELSLSTGPLFHTDTGSGRPVIAAHGTPATSRDFRWLDSALEGRLRLIRLDLPGFGRTPERTSRDQTLPALGEVVVEAIEALGLEGAVVLGHSMGSVVALEAAAASERVAGLALVNGSGPMFHRGTFPRTYRVIERVVDLHPLARRATAGVLLPVARLAGYSKRLSEAEQVWALRLCARQDPARFERTMRALDKPVLVAWAEDDPSVEPKVSRALIACVNDPEVVRFAKGGHNLQASQAVELADALVRWSASL